MTLDQVDRYIELMRPHITTGTKLNVSGGEPTLHPQIFEILDKLTTMSRPRPTICLLTNAHGDKVLKVLEEINKRYVRDAHLIYPPLLGRRYKTDLSKPFWHTPCFRAPIDYPEELKRHFPSTSYELSDNCYEKQNCGYGLTPFGVFLCQGAAAIAYLFHLDIGLDYIPPEEEIARLQNIVCSYCFDLADRLKQRPTHKDYYKEPEYNDTNVSPTYKKALADYDPSYRLSLF